MEGADHRELELRQSVGLVEEIVHGARIVAGMQADRQVQVLGHGVEREEIGVGELAVAGQPAHEDAAGAVGLGAFELRAHQAVVVERQERRQGDPAQAALPGRPDIGEPAIVAAVDREFDLGPPGDRPQEQAGIEHLDVDGQLVHVGEPLVDIAKLAGCAVGVAADIALARDEAAVNAPIFGLRVGTAFDRFAPWGRNGNWPVGEVGPFHIGPGGRSLDDMGVGIYNRHSAPCHGAPLHAAMPYEMIILINDNTLRLPQETTC